MTDTDLHKPSDEDSAAEYALHLMAPAERAAFEARLAAEPALRAMVDFWHDRLSPLDGEFAPAVPPANLFAKVEARLFETPARQPMVAVAGGRACGRSPGRGGAATRPVRP